MKLDQTVVETILDSLCADYACDIVYCQNCVKKCLENLDLVFKSGDSSQSTLVVQKKGKENE